MTTRGTATPSTLPAGWSQVVGCGGGVVCCGVIGLIGVVMVGVV